MQTSRATSYPRQAGITIIELLAAMVILSVVTTLLIAGWISLQNSYAHSVKSSNARAEVRDAVARMSRDIRDAQPIALTSPGAAPFTLANPMEIVYYSAFNAPGVRADGTGLAALRLTRVYLDTGGSSTQKTLYWQRDTNSSGGFDSADRKIVLARNVVNNSIANANVSPATTYTAVFTYGYRTTSGDFTTTSTVATADLTKIISVGIRLIVDVNLGHKPAYADLQTTVRPRNAPQD